MPNRIIHEKALRSETLSKLSAEAERLFWRLTAVADDQGRFDAYPATVKADCFPRLVDSIKTEQVAFWMVELGQEICKFYTVEGRPYGVFVNWGEYQRIYGNKPKFPAPPIGYGNDTESAAIPRSSPQTAADCGSSPQFPAVPRTSRESAALILIPTPITTSTTTVMGSDGQASKKPSPSPVVSLKRKSLEEFTVTEEVRDWARQEFSVEIPDDTIEEFKDHWRKEPEKKLRTNWKATFQGNIRKLVGWGVLKPKVSNALLTGGKCQERVKRGNFLKPCGEPAVGAIGGRPLCQQHKEHHESRTHAVTT